MSEQLPGTPRAVRSFVKRGGRTTAAQARAIDVLWSRFGIPADGSRLDFTALFGREAPRVLEIGFGDGEALVERAKVTPHCDFLGLEVHPPGVGHCLMLAEQASLTNLRIAREDAVEVLKARIAPSTLAEVLIWFPDPWPKKRHHKRRLLGGEFVALLAGRMQEGALLRFASDWAPYADEALTVLQASNDFINLAPGGGFAPRPAERIVTKFERRGLRLGHSVYDLLYRRC